MYVHALPFLVYIQNSFHAYNLVHILLTLMVYGRPGLKMVGLSLLKLTEMGLATRGTRMLVDCLFPLPASVTSATSLMEDLTQNGS